MAQELRFALTDDKGQIFGTPKAQIETIAQGKADAVEAKIPDVTAFAKKTDIPDVSELATKAEIPDVSTLAKKTDIPDVSGLAAKTEIPDTSTLATKTEISSLASKTELANAISTKADTSLVDSKIAAAKSQILASVGEGGGSTAAQTRLVPLALTVGQDDYTVDLTKRASASNRIPIKYSTPVSKWRIHLRNANPRTGRSFTGAVTIDGIWLGVHDRSSVTYTTSPSVNAGGKYLGTPTKIVNTFTTPEDGSEWVSDWITAEIGDGTERLLEVAYSNVTGGSLTRQLGGSYYVGAGRAGNPDYAGGWVEGDTPFDVWLEAEVPAATPVIAVYGDSLSVGVKSERPVIDSPLSVYTFAHGALPVHYAASGDTMTSWNAAGDTGWKVNRWDSLSKADALLFSMGSNDVFSNVSLSSMQSKFSASLSLMGKRIKDGAPVYLSTILPRTNKVDSGSTTLEAIRRQYNTWLKTQKGTGNIKDVIDIAPAVSTDDEALMSAFDVDGVHVTSAGYKAIADTLSLPPLPDPPKPSGGFFGIQEVTSAPALDIANGRVQEYYAVKDFTLQGEQIAVDSAFVVRQKVDGTWQIAIIGKDAGFRDFSTQPASSGSGTGITSPAATSYSAEVLKDNPAIFLGLDEDAIGAVSNRGTATGMKFALVGGATMGGSAIGTLSKSLNINDSTNASYLSVDGGSLPAYTAGTLEYVVSLESASAGISTFARFGTNLESLGYQGVSGKFTSSAYATTGTSNLANGQYHIAVVWDGANITFYKNGVQVTTKPYVGGTPLGAISGGKIGAGVGGRIAGVAFIPSALSASRVQAHAKAAGLG